MSSFHGGTINVTMKHLSPSCVTAIFAYTVQRKRTRLGRIWMSPVLKGCPENVCRLPHDNVHRLGSMIVIILLLFSSGVLGTEVNTPPPLPQLSAAGKSTTIMLPTNNNPPQSVPGSGGSASGSGGSTGTSGNPGGDQGGGGGNPVPIIPDPTISSDACSLTIAPLSVDTSWPSLSPCVLPEIVCDGFYANCSIGNPTNCSEYFLCNGRQLYPMSCPKGALFSYTAAACVTPKTVAVGMAHCTPPCNNTCYMLLVVSTTTPASVTPSTAQSTATTTTPTTIITEIIRASTTTSSTSTTTITSSTSRTTTTATTKTTVPTTTSTSNTITTKTSSASTLIITTSTPSTLTTTTSTPSAVITTSTPSTVTTTTSTPITVTTTTSTPSTVTAATSTPSTVTTTTSTPSTVTTTTSTPSTVTTITSTPSTVTTTTSTPSTVAAATSTPSTVTTTTITPSTVTTTTTTSSTVTTTLTTTIATIITTKSIVILPSSAESTTTSIAIPTSATATTQTTTTTIATTTASPTTSTTLSMSTIIGSSTAGSTTTETTTVNNLSKPITTTTIVAILPTDIKTILSPSTTTTSTITPLPTTTTTATITIPTTTTSPSTTPITNMSVSTTAATVVVHDLSSSTTTTTLPTVTTSATTASATTRSTTTASSTITTTTTSFPGSSTTLVSASTLTTTATSGTTAATQFSISSINNEQSSTTTLFGVGQTTPTTVTTTKAAAVASSAATTTTSAAGTSSTTATTSTTAVVASQTIIAATTTTTAAAETWTTTTKIIDPCTFLYPCIFGKIMADPEDCTRYYLCTNSSAASPSLILWTSTPCPANTSFDYIQGVCTQTVNNAACNFSCPVEILIIITEPPVKATEGSLLEMICYFQVRFYLRQIAVNSFTWFLNGIALTPTGLRISSVETGPDASGVWMSTLTINPLLSSDSGSISCRVMYGNQYIISNVTTFQVIPLPVVVLSPSSVTVVSGTNVSLYCSGSVPATYNGALSVSNVSPLGGPLTFKWFQNGQLINASSASTSSGSQTWQSVLALPASPIGAAQYHCSVANNAGSKNSNICTVSTISTSAGQSTVAACDPGSVGGILWPLTAVNTTSQHPCSPPFVGQVLISCNTGAVWNSPDFSQCLSPALSSVLSQISQVEQGIGVDDPAVMAGIVSGLKNFTASMEAESNLMTSGDFNASLQALSSITTLRTSHTNPDASEISDMLQTVSNLLNPVFNGSWIQLISSDPYAAVALMRAVDVYGQLWAKSLNLGDAENFTTNFLVLQVTATSGNLLLSYPQGTPGTNWPSATNDNITLYLNNSGNPNVVYYVASSYYNNLNSYLPNNQMLNSRILSLAVTGLPPKVLLNSPVSLTFRTLKDFGVNFTRNCVYWNFTFPPKGNWSNESLLSMQNTGIYTTCNFSHLTNFAILMSPVPATGLNALILSIISMIGCIISIIALVLTIVLYAMRWKKVKSHHAVVLINLCIALIAANVIFLAGADKTPQQGFTQAGCIVVAVLLHFFFLAAFFMMLAEGIQLLLYVIFVFHQRRRRETVALIIAAWFIPAVIVAVTLGITQTNGYGAGSSCWLSVSNGVIWAFVAPALLVIAINIVIAILVLQRIITAKMRVMKDGTKERIKETLWNMMAIMPVLGITWIFGVLSVNQDLVAFQYIFAIANSLQGLFIFIFHGLCNKRAKCGCRCLNNKSKYSVKSSPAKVTSRRSKSAHNASSLGNGGAAVEHPNGEDDYAKIIDPDPDRSNNQFQLESNSSSSGQRSATDTDKSSLSSESSDSSQSDSDIQSVGTSTTDMNSHFSGVSRQVPVQKRQIIDSSQL